MLKINNKIEALAKHLGCTDTEEITQDSREENRFNVGCEEYLVLTDEEADKVVKELILDTVWAFNPNFIAAHTNVLDSSDIASIQANEKCEGNNKILTKLIKNLNHFVKDAVLSDGRGHFISTYDGEEHNEGIYYIYRTN